VSVKTTISQQGGDVPKQSQAATAGGMCIVHGDVRVCAPLAGRTPPAVAMLAKRSTRVGLTSISALKIGLLLLFILVLSTIPKSNAFAQVRRALTRTDLAELLQGGVYSERVASLIQERGINFVPGDQDLEALRQAGASEIVLQAVLSARRILPQQVMQPAPAVGPTPKAFEAEEKPPTLPTKLASQQQLLPGMQVTMQNWRQYRQFMPVGMIELFEGNQFWKMPADIVLNVGPTTLEEVPANYARATEEYSRRVRVAHLPNGHNDVLNYVAGEPFPEPQEPDKGYKLLADLWFAYVPHLAVGGPQNLLNTCTQDRLGDISCLKISYVYRQTAYNTDPGIPRSDPSAKNVWYTEWVMVEEPEQAKYTTQLTLFFKDNQRNQDLYIYIPSLRLTTRGSLASRCSPVVGTDYVQDDYKSIGFNGGLAIFDADFIEHRKILALTGELEPVAGDFPNNYDMPLGFPRPSWGSWQVRDVDVIDVHRIPSEQAGYCFAKRVIYEDARTHYALWEDAYDSGMRLWKSAYVAQRLTKATRIGYIPGAVTSSVWNFQNDHMTNVSTQDKHGHDLLADYDVPAEYQNFDAYATPAGLASIMK
jgi:hypothetical protein